MKSAYVWLLGLALCLTLTACARPISGTDFFVQGEEQVGEQMGGTEDRWSYQLTAERYPLHRSAADRRLLVDAFYDLPRMAVFHADGTPYDERAEALAPAVTVASRVNESFRRQFALWQENFREIAALAAKDYAEGNGPWTNEDYFYTDSVAVTFWNNSRIACLTLSAESFTGGEHSITSRTAMTFDMQSGREITINDMVDDYAALRDTVALEILSQIEDGRYLKYYDGEVLFADYRETIPEWMTRTVFFGTGQMTVVFSAYDIAPYSAGEQAFTISYDLIEPYLNDYGRAMLEIS